MRLLSKFLPTKPWDEENCTEAASEAATGGVL